MHALDLNNVRNKELATAAEMAFNRRTGPRVGDFVHMLDGTLRRFTYDWHDGLQTTSGGQPGDASFFMNSTGYAEFSGSLDSIIPLHRIMPTPERRMGWFWMFDEGYSGGGRGRMYQVECRVYRQLEEVKK